MDPASTVTAAAAKLRSLPLPMSPRRPVFIIGCARSGTSVLKRVLGQHADVAALPSEGNELWHPLHYPWVNSPHDVPPYWADPERYTRASVASWPPRHGELIKRHFGWYQTLRRRSAFLNKSSMITFMLPEVQALFPDARFVHIVRDGRAVALSHAVKEAGKMKGNEALYREHGVQRSFDELLLDTAHLWNRTLERIDQVAAEADWAGRDAYLECRYEDFCADPAATLERLLAFLDLGPERMGRYETVSSRNYKLRESLSDDQLARLEEVLGPMLARKGYNERFSPVDAGGT
jgi:hypothetical protein